MLKKIFIASLFLCCTSVTFADQAILRVINQTETETNWLAFAQMEISGQDYRVCAKGFKSTCDFVRDIPIPAGTDVYFDLNHFAFGNAQLGNIDSSCHTIFYAQPNEVKTVTITAHPSNLLDWNSRIYCQF